MGLLGIFHRTAATQEKKALHEVVDLDEEAKKVLKEDSEIETLLNEVRSKIIEMEKRGGKINADQRTALGHIKNHVEKKDLHVAKFHLDQIRQNLEADLERLKAA